MARGGSGWGACACKDAGAALAARAIGRNPSLETLTIGLNGIGPTGCGAIAEAVAAHPSLTELWLG